MEKIILYLLFALFTLTKAYGEKPMIFMTKPIHVYPDGSKIMRMLSHDKCNDKIFILQNADETYFIGMVPDPEHKITEQTIASSNVPSFPYLNDMVFGNKFNKDGEFIGNVLYGISEPDFKGSLTDADIMAYKEWNDPKTGRTYIFAADHTGSVKIDYEENGFAQQTGYGSGGRARGSNQYQTRYKVTGLTGGYSYIYSMQATYKFTWRIVDNKLLVTLGPNPVIKTVSIKTSLDNDNNQKTPSMKAKQWVRKDILVNPDVQATKENLLASIKYVIGEKIIKDKIAVCKSGVIVTGGESRTYLFGKGTDYRLPGQMVDDEADDAFNKCVDGFMFQILMTNGISASVNQIVSSYFPPLYGFKKGDYIKNSYKLENWIKLNYTNRNGGYQYARWSDIEQASYLSQLKNIVGVVAHEPLSFELTPDKNRFYTKEPLFTPENIRFKMVFTIKTEVKKGVFEYYKTDLCLAANEGFKEMTPNGAHIGIIHPYSFTFLEKVDYTE